MIAELRLRLFVILVVVSTIFSLGSAETELTQLHVVTRHGSRMQLKKDGDTLEENSEPTLTALGQFQLFDLGQWLRERYDRFGLFDSYSHSRVRMESSSFDRTIVSANSLALGLFGPSARDPHHETLLPEMPANVPVYSKDADNDVTIRAYDKCAGGLALDDLYTSDEWTSIEDNNKDLLHRLGEIDDFRSYAEATGSVPLKDLWNVFDAVHVANTECRAAANSTGCTSADPSLQTVLTDDEWAQVQDLAHQAELIKFGRESGRLAGINLLNLILNRMSTASIGQPSFYHYSAHYPTLLGLLVALGDNPLDSEVIPEYASALIFELHRDTRTGLKRLKVFYKPGGEELATQISVASICLSLTTDGQCPLGSVAPKVTLFSEGQWCQECGNDSAYVCMRQALSRSSYRSDRGPSRALVGTLAGLAALLVAVAATAWVMRRQVQKRECSASEPKAGVAPSTSTLT